MLVSRITRLTKDDVIDDGRATCLAISPARPAVDVLFGARLHSYRQPETR
jgi:hypothetical protein